MQQLFEKPAKSLAGQHEDILSQWSKTVDSHLLLQQWSGNMSLGLKNDASANYFLIAIIYAILYLSYSGWQRDYINIYKCTCAKKLTIFGCPYT